MKTNKYKLLITVVSLIATSGICSSQNLKKDTINLEEVVVTGTKTEVSERQVPFSVSAMNMKEIENTGHHNILTMLNSYIPGIFVTERNVLGFGVSTGGSGSISIRGVSGPQNNRVLVLIDGQPQYQGIFGHPLSDAYVATDVQRVEVVRGPGSVLYGSNAMGGVINIISRSVMKEGFSGTLGASYGSYDTRKYYATAGFKKNKFSIFTSFNHDQTDGVRDSTDFSINNGYAKLSYELSNNFKLTADFNIADFIANDNGPVFAPKPFNIDITRGKTSFSLENKFKKSVGAIRFYHNYGVHDLSDGWHSEDRNSGIMLYQTFRLFEDNSITAGSDIKQFGGIANRGVSANSFKTVNEIAFYGYFQQKMFQKLTLTGGLRLENNSLYGNQLVPMGGFTYEHNACTTIKGSVSKGFRSPTIMELYLFAPNETLKPETMINYELSWLQKLMDSKMDLEFTVFMADGKNLIEVAGQYPNIKRENIGVFNNRGVEFAVRYMINKNLLANANYSFTDLSTPILAVPRHQFNLGLNYNLRKWNFNATLQHVNGLYTSTVPVKQQSYTLVNSRLSYMLLKNLDLFVTGSNLLNRNYEINYGYPMAKINFSGGLKIIF
jgi:iron complex outermembrane receptor protein